MISIVPLSVAIADDNRDHAESLASLVTLWGHDAYVYLEPDTVMEFYQKFWPDVMLLDIGFPLRSDGLAVARKARQLTQTKVSTIIAITGFDDEETKLQAKEAGFDHFFVKPIDLDRLQTLLSTLHKQIA
jgi:DNA-binding response OmpR family regulator